MLRGEDGVCRGVFAEDVSADGEIYVSGLQKVLKKAGGSPNEGPGLKPQLICSELPRAEARCYSKRQIRRFWTLSRMTTWRLRFERDGRGGSGAS
jgi:hypothetical protein